MSSTRRTPLVICTEPLSERPAQWLEQRARVAISRPGAPGFERMLAAAEGLIVRTDTSVDEPLLSGAGRLRVVGRAGVGVENIDLAACRTRGVQVVYTPEANTQAVVEYVLALLLDWIRPRVRLTQAPSLDAWRQMRRQYVGRRQISELTVGILGLGRIGSRVARVMGALGSPTIYNDLEPIPEQKRHGAVPVEVEELFARSDLVTIHVDGRPANRGLVAGRLLQRLRPHAILINTSRGSVVDSRELAAFLAARPEATAILDVHEQEPFDTDYPLLCLPNAHLAPHLAGRTTTGLQNMSWVVRDVIAVLDGSVPRHGL